MSGYLSLSIPVFLNRFNNHFVPLFPVLQYSFLENFFQVRSIHITVALGDVRNVLAFLDMGKQTLPYRFNQGSRQSAGFLVAYAWSLQRILHIADALAIMRL